MKALVTGGNGFIGSHLVDRLLAGGHDVRCVVRRGSRRAWLAGKPVAFHECDQVNDAGFLREAVRDVDVVFHGLGTLTAPNLEAFREVNVRPVRMLLDACRAEARVKRFVLLGSHGAVGPNPPGHDGITEEDPCHPVSAYGRSKLEAEQVTREYTGLVPWTVLRLSAVYGPRDPSFLRIFRSAHRRGFMPQLGPEPKVISLAHVRDIAEGICLAGFSDRAVDRTYFLSSEQPYSFEELRAGFEAVMNKKVKIRVIPGGVVSAMMLWSDFVAAAFGKHLLLNRDRLTTMSLPRWVCDVSRARNELGFRQTVSLVDGSRETYQWYLKEGWL